MNGKYARSGQGTKMPHGKKARVSTPEYQGNVSRHAGTAKKGGMVGIQAGNPSSGKKTHSLGGSPTHNSIRDSNGNIM